MFSTVFRYNLLITLRQKAVIFWSLAFPIILSLLFSLAFANLSSANTIREAIPLAYVKEGKQSPLFDLQAILASIPRQEGGEEKLFNLTLAGDQEEARQLVLDNKVAAAVMGGDTPQLMVNSVGIRQVVVKQVLDQVSFSRQTVVSLAKHNPLTLGQDIVGQLNNASFVKPIDLSNGRMQQDVIYYFALLAMTCLGACSAGVVVITTQQANKSVEGARSSAAPVNKWLRVTAAGLATWLVQVLMSYLVFAFMALVLKRNFGDNTAYILLLLALGTLMGFLMGMAIACVLRGSVGVVIGISTGVYLLSSFLTGLMSDQVKRLVDTSLPWLKAINPGSMIVDSFYSLYYYRDVEYRYMFSILLTCLVFMAVIAATLRRRYHDSI